MRLLNLPSYNFNFKIIRDKQYIFDEIRKKYVANTPEEWVRQNFIRYLIAGRNYPQALISVEHVISLNRLSKRCDAVVHSKSGNPLMILEFKAPDISVGQKVFDQIVRYNLVLKVNFLLVTNGLKHYCCKINFQNKDYNFLNEIPGYEDLT
ncbi:MAG: type I restriction enzyme HsdR N-terminal domain-containing protein [Bacteroidales bacterium]|nr:type I restriction enzyme HsdR N-terminal domain-containing protein [Bacteroidales bacterium]